MTTQIHLQTGIPPHKYPAHVEAVLSPRARVDLPPTTPKYGHSFASPQYRREAGLMVNGRYDWLLFVAALAICGLVLAGLAIAFHS